ncbi:unnamed protein product, partial [Oncorhynchus mykiss]
VCVCVWPCEAISVCVCVCVGPCECVCVWFCSVIICIVINLLHGQCANIGPADYNYDETISTLRYANRAKNIKNKARINEDPKDALLRQFQKEIEELRKKLQEGEEISGSEGSGSEEMDEGDDEGREGRMKRRGKGPPFSLSLNRSVLIVLWLLMKFTRLL